MVQPSQGLGAADFGKSVRRFKGPVFSIGLLVSGTCCWAVDLLTFRRVGGV